VSLVGLLLLQCAALAGLVVGRHAVLVPLLAAVSVATFAAGPEAGALGLLSGAGFALGAHLHKVIADDARASRPRTSAPWPPRFRPRRAEGCARTHAHRAEGA
jgi:hypothetical protein